MNEANVAPPVLQVEQNWDESPPSRGVVVFVAVAGAFFALITALWLVVAARNIGHDSSAVPLGNLGLAMLAAGAAGLFFSRLLPMTGRVGENLTPSVTSLTDGEWGPGVRLERNSHLLSLALVMAGCVLYGSMAWWSWRSGLGDELLPVSRDDSTGATVALVVSISMLVCLLLLIFVRFTRVSYELYPAGIICRAPRRTTIRIAWDEITDIQGQVRKLSAYYTEAPVVTAVLADESTPPRHRPFDRTGEVGIPACILRCDSNLLLAATIHLHRNPHSRHLLATEAALPWFTTRYHQIPPSQ